jgi:hypothetical protein
MVPVEVYQKSALISPSRIKIVSDMAIKSEGGIGGVNFG